MTEPHDDQHDDRADFGGEHGGGDQPDEADVTPPTVPLVTAPGAAGDDPQPADETTDPGTDVQAEVSDEAGGTAPTQPGDEGVPFRPSSDFEEAAE